MMKKHIRPLLLGALILGLQACSDDFLETTPTSSTSTETVFSSTENVKMAINGMAYLMCVQHSAWSQGYCGENRIKSIYMEYPSQKKAHALESSPRLGGLQSLQPRTGVLAVEGLESLAWRTGNALYCRHTCIFHQKHLSLNFQNLKKKQAWQIPSCPG